jgi:iron-sulfur cluster assembly protein
MDKPDKIRQLSSKTNHQKRVTEKKFMSTPVDITNQVTLTQSAAQAVHDVMANKNLQDYALRLFISGGGCSGYQYGLALDNNIRSEDTIIETDGIKLVVDDVSIKYLQGATVDYVEGMTASGFKIDNPNAAASCGCGQSFNSSQEDSACGCSGCG